MEEAHQREVEVAWAAGLLDGEGCLTATKDGTPRLAVDMTDRRAIRRLKRIFGGTVRNYAHKGGRRRVWRWAAPAGEISGILTECLPHFTTKAQEALVLLRWIYLRAHTTRRSRARQKGLEGTRRRLKALKQGASGHLPRYPRQVNPSTCQPGPPKLPWE